MTDIITIRFSTPTFAVPTILTQEDVWGKVNEETFERESNGMIVARDGDTCPVWGDVLSGRSETVICGIHQANEVAYWLEFVNGAKCIVNVKPLPDYKVAIRSQYRCW